MDILMISILVLCITVLFSLTKFCENQLKK